jgi:hypothetical protein
MSAPVSTPTTFTLPLTEEERAELARLLEHVLGETRVEVHRTHTPAYRDQVLHQEALIRGPLDKVRQLRP